VIGHFSRFIDVGALRIDSSLNNSFLKQVAFKNPDGRLVVIVQNESEEDTHLSISLKEKHIFNIFARSISTIIIEGDDYE
jgi:glucosylceramidase